MDKQLQVLRKKMERFNAWEAENHLGLSISKRMEQFVILYDLAAMYDDKILMKMNKDHLDMIVSINKRLNQASKLISTVNLIMPESRGQKSEIRN